MCVNGDLFYDFFLVYLPVPGTQKTHLWGVRIFLCTHSCVLRPILMTSDLQSVKKVSFSTFAWVFAPEMLKIGISRLIRNVSGFSPRSIRGLFPVARNHRRHVFGPNKVNMIAIGIGSKNTFFFRLDRI